MRHADIRNDDGSTERIYLASSGTWLYWRRNNGSLYSTVEFAGEDAAISFLQHWHDVIAIDGRKAAA
jgi:hypothetical protein